MWQGNAGQWNAPAPPRGQHQARGPGSSMRGSGSGNHAPGPSPQAGLWEWPSWFQNFNGAQPRGQDVGAAGRGNSFSIGSFFGGGQSSLWGSSHQPEEALSIESILHLPGNEECADCGAPQPEWASVNQGTVICINCAGVHRSLGAHISKVKSLRLDAWKPEEMRTFRQQGGNAAVNKRLGQRGGLPSRNNSYPAYLVRPDMPGGKPDISEYIRRKYHATGSPELGWSGESSGPMQRTGKHGAPSPGPSSASGAGRTCFQGACFVEMMGVEISEERARDLRMMGPLFLSLSVTMSLGTITAEPSSAKRASSVVVWDPPERRELLWDCQERWLWCRVYDGAELMGLGQLAAEGRIDLRLLGDAGNVEVALDLYASGGDDSDDEGVTSRRRGYGFGAPPGYFQDSRGKGMHEDPSDPSVTGQLCGVARLRVTLIDMSGMDSGKKPSMAMDSGKRSDRRAGQMSQGQGYPQGQNHGQMMVRQNEGSTWDFLPRDLQSTLSALLGPGPGGFSSSGQPNRAGHSWT